MNLNCVIRVLYKREIKKNNNKIEWHFPVWIFFVAIIFHFKREKPNKRLPGKATILIGRQEKLV